MRGQVMQQQLTTGNSNIGAKTGSTYIFGVMTDSTEILAATFSTMASSIKVFPSDCDHDR